MSKKPVEQTVAEFIDERINYTEKTAAQVAHEVGFPKPNFLSMIRKGKSKLPYSKLRPMADSLGVDPASFLERVMSEYDPELWAMINDIMEPKKSHRKSKES